MASSPTSAADSLEFFKKHGFYYLEDATIGSIAKQVDDQGKSTSLESWENFEHVLLGDERIRRIIEPFLNEAKPRMCSTFGSDPAHIYCFWPEPQEHRLVVAIWGAGSSMEFFDHSHIGTSKAIVASNGLFEMPPGRLKANGSEAKGVQMDRGGVAILAVRCGFRRLAGFTIVYGFENPV